MTLTDGAAGEPGDRVRGSGHARSVTLPGITAGAVWFVALAAIVLLLSFFAYHSLQLLTFPHEVEYVEGLVLDWSRQILAGSLPYKAVQPFPWSFSVYTPGYLAAVAAGLRHFPELPWLVGRAISLASALLLGFLLIAQMPGREETTGGRSFGFLAAGLWLASPYLFRWGTFARPDMFALLWSALGIVLVERAVKRGHWLALLLSALCFVASFWSKQSFFAAPIAATFFLLWKRWRYVPAFLFTGAVSGALAGYLLWQRAGTALFENLVVANANAYSWESLLEFQQAFLTTVPILILLSLSAIFRWRERGDGTALYGIYLALAFLVSLSIGKAGAWENYFLETLWILCVLSGWRLAALSQGGGWRVVMAPLLVLAQLAFYAPGFERRSLAEEDAWLEQLRAEGEVLHATVAAIPEDAVIWSEHAGVLSEVGRAAPLFGFGYSQLEKQELWDPTPLTDRLATGAQPLVIQQWDAVADPLGQERWSRSMMNASERGYALGERAGRWLQREPFPFHPPDEQLVLQNGFMIVDWMAARVAGDDPCVESAELSCEGEVLNPPVALEGGEPVAIHLLWQSDGAKATPVSVSVQLFDAAGTRVAQHDAPIRRTGLGGAWPAGALVRDEHLLSIPEQLSPGAYSLLVSLYESESGMGVATTTIRAFKVAPPPPTASLSVWRDVAFGDTLRLLERDPAPRAVEAGSTLTLRSHWELLRAPAAQLTTFLHLVAPTGAVVAQSDFTPDYPPSLWSVGEVVEITYTISIPDDLPLGTYELRLGWYDPVTLERVPAQSADAVEGALRAGTMILQR